MPAESEKMFQVPTFGKDAQKHILLLHCWWEVKFGEPSKGSFGKVYQNSLKFALPIITPKEK